MATRYFKGTDGIITVFRASGTKVYHSVTTKARHGGQSISFSGAMPFADRHPVHEITKAEYDALQTIKAHEAQGRRPNRSTGPQDSWVTNAVLNLGDR